MPLRKRKKGGFYRLDLTTKPEQFKVVSTNLNTGEVKDHGTFPTVEEAIDTAKEVNARTHEVCHVYGNDNRAVFSTER